MKLPIISAEHTPVGRYAEVKSPVVHSTGIDLMNCNPDNPDDLTRYMQPIRHYCNNYSCANTYDCGELLARSLKAQNCANERMNMNRDCYNGGDQTHRDEAARAQDSASFCRSKYNRLCAGI